MLINVYMSKGIYIMHFFTEILMNAIEELKCSILLKVFHCLKNN